ncbi:MAG: hypothetical protein U0Q12_02305 [Vicinamibacterales bacterium]
MLVLAIDRWVSVRFGLLDRLGRDGHDAGAAPGTANGAGAGAAIHRM